MPFLPFVLRNGRVTGRTPCATRAAVAALALLGLGPGAGAQPAYEAPPHLRPEQVLPSHLVRSGHHRVLDDVTHHDNMLEFEIESDYGRYRARSIPLAIKRIDEITVLVQAIDQFNRAGEKLGDRLRGQLRVGADSFVDILASPLRTTGKLATQFGRNVGQTFEELGGTDPDRRVDAKTRKRSLFASFEPGDPVLAEHKRNAASQLGLDVYSTNPQVQSFLDSIARARASGNRTAGVVTISRPRDTQAKVGGGLAENAVRAAITRMSINQLYRRNSERLTDAGIEQGLVDRFLVHPPLSPRHKTEIAEYVGAMSGVAGLGAALDAALATASEAEVMAAVQVARMLALYHERVSPLRALRSGGHVTLAATSDGALVAALPFDLVYWSEEAARTFAGLAEYAASRDHGEVILISYGVVSEAARRALEGRGISVRSRFPFSL